MPTFDYDSSQGGGGLLDEGYDFWEQTDLIVRIFHHINITLLF